MSAIRNDNIEDNNYLMNNKSLKELADNSEIALELLDKLDIERKQYRVDKGYLSWKYDSLFKSGEDMTNAYRLLIENIKDLYFIAVNANHSMQMKNKAELQIIASKLKNIIFDNLHLLEIKSRLNKINQWLQIDAPYKKAPIKYLEDIYRLYITIDNLSN
jgi:hypothetical protein